MMKRLLSFLCLALPASSSLSQTPGQMGMPVYGPNGLSNRWVTPQNNKVFGIDGTGALVMTDAAGAMPITETIGPVAGGSPLNASAILCAYNPGYQQGGLVNSVELDIGVLGNGQIRVVHVRETAVGIATIIASQLVTVTATGLQTVVPGTAIALMDDTDYIGVQNVTGGAQMRYRSNNGATGYRYFLGTAAGSGVSFTLQSPGEIYYRVTITYTPVEEPAGIETRQAMLEDAGTISALPAGWTNAGSFSFSAAGARATASGLANQLRSGHRYGLSRMVHRYRFSLGATGNVIGFLVNPVEGGVQAGSYLQLDCANNTLAIMGRYTGANTPTVLASASIGFTLAIGHTYELEWERNGRSFTARLQDLTGPGYYEVTRAASPVGYSTYPAYGYDQGTMQGAPGLAWISGGATGPLLITLSSYAIGSAYPKAYVIGDSITEGFAVSDEQRWGQLLASAVGEDQVHLSGIGGAVTGGALVRMGYELVNMKPDYVVIFLGTNGDGSFSANLTSMVTVAQAAGAQVVVCTVPTSSANTTIVNALAAGVIKVPLDKVLTATGAGSTPVAGYYSGTDANGGAFNDGLHPNSAGHARMFICLQSAVPALFY